MLKVEYTNAKVNTLFKETDSTGPYPALISATIVFYEKKLIGLELEYQESLKKFTRKSNGCNVKTEKKKITILHEYSDLPLESQIKTYKVQIEQQSTKLPLTYLLDQIMKN